ncbi:MAG: FMN-binding glutamate synthase family protein [Firmicutes bacterium]|jgi:glutamate synthase domain-containing protein 2|nr:FMN-binding glutamate synthase family protein [Bacillota bacterium]
MIQRVLGSILRGIADKPSDETLFRITRDKYTDNLLTLLSTLQKTSFLHGMELFMRAAQGESLERPLGSPIRLSPWEKLLLNPVHLFRLPIDEEETIDTSVVIGPRAEKPLRLQIPICIAGMSYGSALSQEAKVALAKAATVMGTATNTGEAGLLPAERESADKLIGQYNRGGYLNTPDKYSQLDAIEIQFGQGAQGASPQRTQAKFIDSHMRTVFGLRKGQDATLGSRIPGISSGRDLHETVRRLREETGVPVGMKIAASHFLEREMAIGLEAEVDFITVDGAEAGTHGASPTAEDDLGLPTIFAIARARRFLVNEGVKGQVSLLASGGLITPGQFLKALALGADAVYIGTAALLALVARQLTKVSPYEPSTQLVLATGRAKDHFNVEEGCLSLVNFLQVSLGEMTSVMYALGKNATRHLDVDDLCCVDPFLAKALDVPYAGASPQDQAAYYLALAQGFSQDGSPSFLEDFHN